MREKIIRFISSITDNLILTVLTAVLVPSLGFPTRRLTGKGILNTSSLLYAARWRMSSRSSNVSLDTEKPCTADSGRMRIVYTRCVPAPIYMRLPGLEGISLLLGKGGTAPFYRVRWSLSVKIVPAASYLLGLFCPARSTLLEIGGLFRDSPLFNCVGFSDGGLSSDGGKETGCSWMMYSLLLNLPPSSVVWWLSMYPARSNSLTAVRLRLCVKR